jgi:hypothetical protein
MYQKNTRIGEEKRREDPGKRDNKRREDTKMRKE